MEEEVKKKKKKHRISIMYIIGGGILTEDFITKHTKLLVLIVILLFFYISNRYTCNLKLRDIDRLQRELKDVKYEALSISAELTSNTRPSQVETLVDKLGLQLEKAKTPPYKLQK